VAGALHAAAQSRPGGTNTVIVADTMNFDYRRMIAGFEGNVDVVAPQVRILSDKLTVIFEGTNTVRSVTAVGHVRVYHLDKQATSDQAVYVARSAEIELTGNARLYWKQDQIFGKKIVFWLNDEKVRVEPATLVIRPAEGAAAANPLDILGGKRAGAAGGGARPKP
jgi:lipopolysaccharide transport protein LptA